MQTRVQFESELAAKILPIAKYQWHAIIAIRTLCAVYLTAMIFPLAPPPVPYIVMVAWGLASAYSIFVVFRLIQAISSTPMEVAFALASAFPLFTLPILFSSNRMALADILSARIHLDQEASS